VLQTHKKSKITIYRHSGLPLLYGQGQASESSIFKELQETWNPFFNGETTSNELKFVAHRMPYAA
jgi:hypothetical protein